MENRPKNYEWWIDSIQDCLYQVACRFEEINARSNACRHVCDETYIELSHFVECVLSNGYNNVPMEHWRTIEDLSNCDDLETAVAKSAANTILDSTYFQKRARWPYSG